MSPRGSGGTSISDRLSLRIVSLYLNASLLCFRDLGGRIGSKEILITVSFFQFLLQVSHNMSFLPTLIILRLASGVAHFRWKERQQRTQWMSAVVVLEELILQ
jgi:hypothetical protein